MSTASKNRPNDKVKTDVPAEDAKANAITNGAPHSNGSASNGSKNGAAAHDSADDGGPSNKFHKIKFGSEIPATLTKERQLAMLRDMLRIRRIEERSAQLYGQGKIGGFCHLYIGQEAVAVGSCEALRGDDYVYTTYRDHGLALVRGCSSESVLGELLGREIGCSNARGGSMHMFKKETNFMGGHGIVGGHIPLAAGTAFASKYRGEDRVTLCFFGDGAVNNGAFHEALNLAALWKLPVVFVCENNRYSMGTAVERSTSVVDIHRKAEAYDMIHGEVDGMDLMAMYNNFTYAVEQARQGKPSFIEVLTYRFRGHSMSDPVHGHYRTEAEVEENKERDPITLWVKSLEDRGLATEKEIEAMDDEVNNEMKQAMAAAEASPVPDVKDVYNYVLVD